MRVLITWGSKRGGTEGIARTIANGLRDHGVDVDLLPSEAAVKATGFDAAIVGGALYAGRWHRGARRFVTRRERDLRQVPVWFFSSGPLDDSSERQNIPPTLQVQALMERVGALGHVTFGGRLAPDVRGFPASAMAKKHAGDWRNEARIQRWAAEIARALPTAHAGPIVAQPGGSILRLFAHATAGWMICAGLMGALLGLTSLPVAVGIHAVAAPVVFVVIARHYFRLRGARDSVNTAIAFVAIVASLDLIVIAGLALRSLAMFRSALGTWVPFALIALVTWAAGEWRWMQPFHESPRTVPATHERFV